MQQFQDKTPKNPKTTANVVGINELCVILPKHFRHRKYDRK
jgi:hypothetical protein